LRESKDISASNRSAIEKAIREIEELQAKEKRAKEGPPKGIAQTPAVTGGSPALTPPPPAPPIAAQAPERAAVNESLKPPATTSTAAPAVATSQPAQAAPAASRTALPPQAVTTTTVAASRGNNRTYAYITGGAAAVLLASGLMFTSRASKFEDELTARPHPQATIDDLSSTAKSSRTMGALFLGAGVAAAVGAGILWFLPSGDGVALQGRF
jgi:hypothetical protein